MLFVCGLTGIMLVNLWIIIIYIKKTKSKSIESAKEEIEELCIKYGKERECRRLKMKLLILTDSIPDVTKKA